MTTIPKKIKAITGRIQHVFFDYENEQGEWWGDYAYQLFAKHPRGYENQFYNDIETLVNWANQNGAYCKVVEKDMWTKYGTFSRAKYHKHHNSAIIIISDPVARIIENSIIINK